jgi:hypothetical protein
MYYNVNRLRLGRSRDRRGRTNAPASEPFRRSGSCAGTAPPISPDRGGSGLHAKPLNAVIGRVFGPYGPGRRAGLNAKKNDEKVPYLQVVSLALSVRRYVTKRIDRRRGSRAIREATG